jgi:hypothetical protein
MEQIPHPNRRSRRIERSQHPPHKRQEYDRTNTNIYQSNLISSDPDESFTSKNTKIQINHIAIADTLRLDRETPKRVAKSAVRHTAHHGPSDETCDMEPVEQIEAFLIHPLKILREFPICHISFQQSISV